MTEKLFSSKKFFEANPEISAIKEALREGEANRNLDDYDFELASIPESRGGTTLCGKFGRNHKMERISEMSTKCIYPGCDAFC